MEIRRIRFTTSLPVWQEELMLFGLWQLFLTFPTDLLLSSQAEGIMTNTLSHEKSEKDLNMLSFVADSTFGASSDV